MKLFDSIRVRRPRLNKFNLSREVKMSLNMGDLVPVMVQEVIPGDKFRVNSESFVRTMEMLAPIMHRVNVWFHYYFVPNRILWDDWEEFITGGVDGTAAPVMPTMTIDQAALDFGAGMFEPGSLADYMGLPNVPDSTTVVQSMSYSALPLRAYQRVWYENFRDQTLDQTDPAVVNKQGGAIASGSTEWEELMALRKRCWEKDYFTSSLPFAQRGAPVMMPISGEATVNYRDASIVRNADDGTAVTGPLVSDIGSETAMSGTGVPPNQKVRIDNIESVEMDNAQTSINDLRVAVRLQEWLEKNARGGARYVEQLLSHWGVISDDARLQRPEYLGGGMSPISVSANMSTFQSDDSEPQGNMTGNGVGVGAGAGFRRKFKEHGWIIGVMSVLPRTAYQQGLDRKWRRLDKLDHAWPEFAHLGEQAVQYHEIFYNPEAPPGPGKSNVDTWGYQSRYADMKYACDEVHGDMRGNLAFWHMGRIFDDVPELSDQFVTSDPTHRVFPVTDPTVHKLYCQLYHRVDALRPLPYYGTPML